MMVIVLMITAKQRQQGAGTGAGERATVNIGSQTIFNQAGKDRPADGGEE